MIQVFEPGSEDEQLMFEFLGKAKHFHECPDEHPGGAQPVAFILGPGNLLSVAPLGLFGDYNDPRVRDFLSTAIRQFAKDQRAHFVALLSDTWRTQFDDYPGIVAEGLDPADYRDWPPEIVARHPFKRREALMMSMEGRSGFKMLWQFYRRERGRIVWEECEVADDYEASGRFMNLLPKED